MGSVIDTIVTALTLQRSQMRGLIVFTLIAVVVSVYYRLRSPAATVPEVTAADTITAGVSPEPSSIRAIPAEVLEEILNIELSDSIYYYISE